MIKYANIPGYIGIGETELCSHLYQWVENTGVPRQIILVSAYENETASCFKGYVIEDGKYYWPVDIVDDELSELEKIVGSITVEKDLNIFASHVGVLMGMQAATLKDCVLNEVNNG